MDLDDQTEGNSGQLVGSFLISGYFCKHFIGDFVILCDFGFCEGILYDVRCTTESREVSRSVLAIKLVSLTLPISLTTPR